MNLKREDLVLSVSPHVKSKRTTRRIVYEVIGALIPAAAFGVWLFGISGLWILLVCIGGCVLTEWGVQKLRKKPVTVADGSAILTGLLLAMVLPPELPLWMAGVGAFVSILIGKQLFGGLGQNIFNPALIGRAFLTAAFPVSMTTWIFPDGISSATPLALAKFESEIVLLKSLIIGKVGGCLGETSAVLLIVGGLYLLIRRIIDWRVPLGIFATVFIFAAVVNFFKPIGSGLFHLFSGGLMIGAWFMATDPVTSPLTKSGRWIFAIGIGILVMIIRVWGGLPEGVMYAILIMNALCPLINRYTIPRQLGG